MQKKYGEINNPLKHTRAFANIVIVADAGYFTIVNLYFVFKNQINAIIKPSSEARQDNNKLRERSGHPKKETKSIRQYFKRVLGGYECNQGKFLGYKKSIPINHRKPELTREPGDYEIMFPPGIHLDFVEDVGSKKKIWIKS